VIRVPGLIALVVCGQFLLGGAVLLWMGAPGTEVIWAVAACLALVPAVRWAWKDLRAKRFGFPLLAVVVLAGALVFGEFFGSAVVAVVLLGVRALVDDLSPAPC
jgi:membrane protease YdiL (CAAX protease family)